MKKIKCLYFLDQTSFKGYISSLSYCDFMKIPENPLEVTKWQKAHISLNFGQIQKIKALYFLQLWKLKKIKCPYFLDPTSYNWDMSILRFCPFGAFYGFMIWKVSSRGSTSSCARNKFYTFLESSCIGEWGQIES